MALVGGVFVLLWLGCGFPPTGLHASSADDPPAVKPDQKSGKAAKNSKANPTRPSTKPSLAPPKRPERTPIDLSDLKACYRELADLASFGMFFNAFENYRANGVGEDGQVLPPDPNEMFDRCVRFERLIESRDLVLKELAKDVRSIYFDVWRVNRGYHYYGFTPGKAYRLYERSGFGNVVSALASIVSDDLAVARAEAGATKRVNDANVVDANRFETLLRENPGGGEAILKKAEKREQAKQDKTKAIFSASRIISSARTVLQQRMEKIWKERLWPNGTDGAITPYRSRVCTR